MQGKCPESSKLYSNSSNTMEWLNILNLNISFQALLRVDSIKNNVDPCACRRGKRRGNKKCTRRCLKPRCKDDDNPDGTCEDFNRCRARGKTLNEILLPGGC